jgi:transcriptional regulator with XRE-family HTH domain
VNLQTTISENLRGYRLKRGLTQEAIAAKAGMSSNHYAQIERAEEGLSLKRWEKLSRLLKIEPYKLLIPHSYENE